MTSTASKEIVAIKDDPMVMQAMRQLNEVKAIQQGVFQQGVHYGPPYKGAKNDTLLKPGATFLQQKYGLHEQHERLETTIFVHPDDMSKSYIIIQDRCRILNSDGLEVAQCDAACTTFEDKYVYRQGTKVCPQCGGEFIIKGKTEYGGGWLCYKAKGGCGAKFGDNDPAITAQDTEKKLNPNPLNLLDTIVAMAQKRAAVRATIKATGVDALFSPGDGVTVDYYDDMDAASDDLITVVQKNAPNPPIPDATSPNSSATSETDELPATPINGAAAAKSRFAGNGAPPAGEKKTIAPKVELPGWKTDLGKVYTEVRKLYKADAHMKNSIAALETAGKLTDDMTVDLAIRAIINHKDELEAPF